MRVFTFSFIWRVPHLRDDSTDFMFQLGSTLYTFIWSNWEH